MISDRALALVGTAHPSDVSQHSTVSLFVVPVLAPLVLHPQRRIPEIEWLVSAVQYAGFTCMPFLGGFLSFVFKDTHLPILGEALVLTSFTAPVINCSAGRLMMCI